MQICGIVHLNSPLTLFDDHSGALQVLEIRSFMVELAGKRPVFHSEADFQHAFAWQLHQQYPESKIRLEYPFQVDRWIYVDIWAGIDEMRYAIELKYRTSQLQFSHQDETYNLKTHSAQDLGRYDFLKDVQRLENITRSSSDTIGLALILTNDRGYWNPGRADTVDTDFRLHEARVISGSLRWQDHAATGTTKDRSESLSFRNQYYIQWQSYSRVADTSRGDFRYCVLEVT